MTVEPIQKTAGAYQGSTAAVEIAPAAPKAASVSPKAAKAPEQQPLAKSDPKADRQNAPVSSDPAKAAEKVAAPDKASDSSLKKAVEEINRKSHNTEAIFGYHEGTNRVIIKIIDKETKEVKKEYPAEETLDMIQKIWEMAGILVDEKR